MTKSARLPFFPHRRLVQATMIVSAPVVMLQFMASAKNGAFHPVTIGSGLALITSFYVLGEVIRTRFRITLRAMLVAIFGICLCSALWGQTLIRSARQRAAANHLVAVGGYPILVTRSAGNWVITDGGWVLPRCVTDALGMAAVGRIEGAEFDGERISAEDIREIDSPIFSKLGFYACGFEEDAAEALGVLQGITDLSVSGCKLTDAEIEGIAQIATLEAVFIVGGKGVTDAGIRHLKNLRSAQSIYLIGFPDLTKEAIEELRGELPNCRMAWRANVP